MNIKYLSIASLLVLAPLGFVVAQEAASDADFTPEEMAALEETVGSGGIPMPANTVSCFDHYSFGSVQAHLTPSITGAVSGTPITFEGSLVNNNPYPIVDGALYVKIFTSRGDKNDGNGPDVVDQFFVKGDIAIPANGSIPVSFSWGIPSYAQTGEYKLATFFTTSRKFNLLGLSFTDDVVGNTVPFSVNGEGAGIVKFEKASVTVNDRPYFFAASPPRIDATSPVTVKATIRNTTGAAQSAVLSWVVYQWDAQLRENVVQEETREVDVGANRSTQVSITVRDAKYPVYLVVGTLKWKDSQSIIGTRFVREGIDRTRINFPGVTSFPLIAGKETTLFSCLHNSGSNDVVSGGRLDLSIADSAGNVIHEYRYEGDITGEMMGVASTFTPQKNYKYFTLRARLYQGDGFIDEANLVYDCAQIDPSLCARPGAAFDISIAVIILAIIALIAALGIYHRFSRPPKNDPTPAGIEG